MHSIEEVEFSCPYCAEVISVLIDGSVAAQAYVEDCEVCCRPMQISYAISSDDEISLQVSPEDE